MRTWLVGGAVIEGPDGLLLVQNRRRDGRLDWSPPGGVIDPGEELIEGLTREVREETGLVVSSWAGPTYEIEAVAPDLGWHLRVEVHRASVVTGDVTIDDPDGIVIAARYVPVHGCAALLAGAARWVREPFGAWLDERWETSRRFEYRIDGTDPSDLRVTASGG